MFQSTTLRFSDDQLDELRLRSLLSYRPAFGYVVAVVAEPDPGFLVTGYGLSGAAAWHTAGRPREWRAFECWPFCQFDITPEGDLRARVPSSREPKRWEVNTLAAPLGRSRPIPAPNL